MDHEAIDCCRSLAAALAPETAGRLHVLPHDPRWPLSPGALAYCCYARHPGIRAALIERGEWSGMWHGAIVFVEPPPDGPERAVWTIHELAHLLPAAPPIPESDDARADHEYIEQLAKAAPRQADRPWRSHGARWLRRIIHLVHRASRLGIELPLEAINAAGPGYGLSMFVNYQAELGEEPRYCTKKSFAEIESLPMPPRFKRLFENDLKQFYRERIAEEIDTLP